MGIGDHLPAVTHHEPGAKIGYGIALAVRLARWIRGANAHHAGAETNLGEESAEFPEQAEARGFSIPCDS